MFYVKRIYCTLFLRFSFDNIGGNCGKKIDNKVEWSSRVRVCTKIRVTCRQKGCRIPMTKFDPSK